MLRGGLCAYCRYHLLNCIAFCLSSCHFGRPVGSSPAGERIRLSPSAQTNQFFAQKTLMLERTQANHAYIPSPKAAPDTLAMRM